MSTNVVVQRGPGTGIRGRGTGKGRAIGTPNKDRDMIVDMLADAVLHMRGEAWLKAHGMAHYDVLLDLVYDATDESLTRKERMSAKDMLRKHCYSERRAVEHHGNININHEDWLKDIPDDE